MALDLTPIQDEIVAFLKSEFPNYEIDEDGIPDDAQLKRVKGKVVNYIVLTWGTLARKPGGRSMAGTRYDDYYSMVDVNMVGAVGRDVRASLSLVTDALIGFRPTGGNEITVEGSGTPLKIRDNQSNVTAYVYSQRCRFGVNGESVGERIPV